MVKSFEEARTGNIPIVVAPTGYGKTMASPWLYSMARSHGLASGLIHVAPLRSLVTKIYRDVFKPLHPGSGYQAHIDLGEGRSSYFLKDLVVTTIDSFLWNLYRIPVTELIAIERGVSMGHYYPVYTSIYTSLTVFDEAHVYLGEGSDPGRAAFTASLIHLAMLESPVIVETATMHPGLINSVVSMLEAQGRRASILAVKCHADRLREVPGLGGRVKGVEDDEWIRGYRLGWRTSIVDGWDSVLEDIVQDSRRGPVLVVANTVSAAVNLYRALRSRIGDAVLVHGRLASLDRAEAEERIGAMRRGVIVSTQVIEVGVDVNAVAVYTEAAPIENLVQRAGRACRRGGILDECRRVGGKMVIVDTGDTGPYKRRNIDYAIDAIRRHNPIDWRLPCTEGDETPYTSLIEESRDDAVYSLAPFISLYEYYLQGDGRPTAMLDLLGDMGMCSIYRDTTMYPIQTMGGEVLADMNWLSRNWDKVLETDGGVKIIITTQDGSVEARIDEDLWREIVKPGRRCRQSHARLYSAISRAARELGVRGVFNWSLKARQGAYQRGIGFSVDAEGG